MTIQTKEIYATQDLAEKIQGKVYLPDDAGYDQARAGWNLAFQQRPLIVVAAKTAEDIVEAVRYADKVGLWVGVQATGHGTLRPADDEMLIVTSGMNRVEVDPRAKTARTEAGAKWGAVLEKAQEHGLAPLLGSSPNVGAVGYTLGGGLGWLARKYGLATDSVIAFEVVTANGEKLRLSKTENASLLWALRGGGGGFAIVTAMEIQLYPVANVYGGTLMYPPSLVKEVFQRYRQWIKTLPEEMTTSIRIANFPPMDFLPEFLRGNSFVMVSGCYCGPVEEGESLIQGWLDWKAPINNDFRIMPFREVASISQDPVDPMPAYHNGAWVRDLPDDAIDTIVKFGLNVDGSSPLTITEVRHVGGAMARADATQSAFGYRGAPFVLDIVAAVPGPDMYPLIDGYASEFKSALQPSLDQGVYMNFLSSKEVRGRTKEAFSEESYHRLVELKSHYDPKNLIRSGFNIKPT